MPTYAVVLRHHRQNIVQDTFRVSNEFTVDSILIKDKKFAAIAGSVCTQVAFHHSAHSWSDTNGRYKYSYKHESSTLYVVVATHGTGTIRSAAQKALPSALTRRQRVVHVVHFSTSSVLQ